MSKKKTSEVHSFKMNDEVSKLINRSSKLINKSLDEAENWRELEKFIFDFFVVLPDNDILEIIKIIKSNKDKQQKARWVGMSHDEFSIVVLGLIRVCKEMLESEDCGTVFEFSRVVYDELSKRTPHTDRLKMIIEIVEHICKDDTQLVPDHFEMIKIIKGYS